MVHFAKKADGLAHERAASTLFVGQTVRRRVFLRFRISEVIQHRNPLLEHFCESVYSSWLMSSSAERIPELLALDEALDELQRHDAPAAQLVKLRFFAGLTHQQAAAVLGGLAEDARRI